MNKAPQCQDHTLSYIDQGVGWRPEVFSWLRQNYLTGPTCPQGSKASAGPLPAHPQAPLLKGAAGAAAKPALPPEEREGRQLKVMEASVTTATSQG